MKDYKEKLNELATTARKLGGELKGPLSAFMQLHHAAMAKGALDSKHKELIALGIAICARCEGCIARHVADALRAGATREEIVEAIGVAISMGGGPATVYGCEAFQALEQLASSAA